MHLRAVPGTVTLGDRLKSARAPWKLGPSPIARVPVHTAETETESHEHATGLVAQRSDRSPVPPAVSRDRLGGHGIRVVRSYGPVRDGIKLHTLLRRPKGDQRPLPILLQRTPYGVPRGHSSR